MTTNTRTPKIPENYQPISMWGYFGYQILFAIPLIGWIIVIILALTGDNINVKNFARSQFCVLIIWLILFLILAATGFLAFLFQGVIQ